MDFFGNKILVYLTMGLFDVAMLYLLRPCTCLSASCCVYCMLKCHRYYVIESVMWCEITMNIESSIMQKLCKNSAAIRISIKLCVKIISLISPFKNPLDQKVCLRSMDKHSIWNPGVVRKLSVMKISPTFTENSQLVLQSSKIYSLSFPGTFCVAWWSVSDVNCMCSQQLVMCYLCVSPQFLSHSLQSKFHLNVYNYVYIVKV